MKSLESQHTNMPYKGVFIWADGVRELESLFEDEEFTGVAAMKSHNSPQHNAGVYVTQNLGAPPKKKKAAFKIVCGGIYGIPASRLVWSRSWFFTVTVKEEGCRLRVTDSLHSWKWL